MKGTDTVLYIHGRGGSRVEADHYRPLFPSCAVEGIEYMGSTPWEAGGEIHEAVTKRRAGYDRVILIANSIGAFFAMHADIEKDISHAFFISPVVDMEKLISGIMEVSLVTEKELKEKERIQTDMGEELSWKYLCYVREHPVSWRVPTDILYGSADNLTSLGTISSFAQAHHASLTVMEGGGHWFHTEAEMQFLDRWIRSRTDR